jgi:hypothetical protein
MLPSPEGRGVSATDVAPRRVPRARRVRAVAARHPLWLEWLTRLGYAARGVVYLVVGGTGLLLALGLAERARGSPGVMRLIVELPMGRLLLAALTVGLVGYSLLSFVAAVRAPEGQPGVAGALARGSDALAGVVYTGLSALAVRLLADPAADTAVAGTRWGARALALPGGRALLLAGGAAAVATGLYLAYKAVALPAATQLERRRTSAATVRVVTVLARLGTAARAVLFVLCGGLIVHAAWTDDPAGVGGLGDALDTLADAPAGPPLVGLVAAGCIAYGCYQLAKARWRRVRLDRTG